MGLRYRKSINLGGGFRVNLSKNGIGYSWGVKGYRVTKTADGRTRQTVSIPGTGLSYVEEHRSGGKAGSAPVHQANPYAGYSDVKQVKSADANSLRSPEYDALFKGIKTAKALNVILVIAAVLTVATVPLCLLFIAGIALLHTVGRFSITYELDDVAMRKWTETSAAWKAVASSKSLEEITATAKSAKARNTGGIENAVDTVKMTSGGKLPWYLKTNISPVVFKFKEQTVAVMPDRLLIFGKKQFGAVAYDELKFDISAFGYLTGGNPPSDSEVVKTVWLYSNNDGSPDRRHSDNRQIPVLKYGKIVITSPAGLNLQFVCSNEDASDRLNAVINGQEVGGDGHEA